MSGNGVRRRRIAAWAVLGVVVSVALAVGSHRPTSPTPAQRVSAIASEVRCPQCAGQSAELSNVAAARAVRAFIAQQVAAGQSTGRIEQDLQDRYGTDILLRPPASGVAGLVWALPVMALVVALGGLVLAFRRWRRMTDAPVGAADRERVAEALAEAARP